MAVVDLSNLSWTVAGWRPFCWRMGKSAETAGGMQPDIARVPARVPGSVQQALLDAGLIDDWHVGLNSRLCEWVEHRHWDFTAEFPAGAVPSGEPTFLDAQGLDYWGWVLVDGKEVARFVGALVPHRIDLSDALGDGKAHQLSIIFEEPPREQGQIGYTSRSKYFKPRYNYSWDWCPRFVPIGVWDSLSLVTGPDAALELTGMRAALADDNRTGRLDLTVAIDADMPPGGHQAATIEAVVRQGDCEVGRASVEAKDGENPLTLDGLDVAPWWPNGAGDQPLYDVCVEARTADGAVVWSCCRRAGFKRLEWRPCEGAAPGAEPWICVVNGEAIFLQGVNWTPLRVGYHDTTQDEYVRVIGLYREMGCNAVRVWGGAMLEKTEFYDLCDAAGILVWQEFPLSSSGVDNLPPRDPDVIADLTHIAASYIRRRAHHVSLLLWSGGNELLGLPEGKTEGEIPVDYSHPCIAALRDLVHREDPAHRFIATSPSGPSPWGKEEGWGKGVHHDVHGPWGMGGAYKDMDAWRAYWEKDDALFRSETGMPGACGVEFLERYRGGQQVFPPVGAYWRHTAAWWTEWLRLEEPMKGKGLADYVEWTQRDQAEAYAIAASACKGRFPRCGGFLIWMGHDCFPCPANNSIIDFERNPKPAYHALKAAFRTPAS